MTSSTGNIYKQEVTINIQKVLKNYKCLASVSYKADKYKKSFNLDLNDWKDEAL